MREPEEILNEEFDNSGLDLREITSKSLQAILNAIETAQNEARSEMLKSANSAFDEFLNKPKFARTKPLSQKP